MTPDDKDFLIRSVRLIKRWHDGTVRLFESKVKGDKAIDHLCITSLTVSGKYCEAITTLLARECRMPAKALLRVLFELGVKMRWCLLIPSGKRDVADEVIEEKIERWMKSTLRQDIKIHKGFKECVATNRFSQIENRIKKLEDLEKSLGCEKMPEFARLVKELPDSWGKELYTQCYLQFNNAVHPDVTSLGGRVRKSGNKFIVDSDSEEKIEDLAKYCITFEHMILYLVRNHYDWDTAGMEKEFSEIKK